MEQPNNTSINLQENKFLKAALEYEAREWSVIPLRPKSKEPLINWKPYQARRATRDEIVKWWTEYPDANVGIVTGKVSGIAVLDIEKEADLSSLHLPPTPIVESGGGGQHRYHKFPSNGITSIPRINGLKADFQAEGKYVVGPPSIHPTGKPYKWLIPPTEVNCADLPKWILEAVKNRIKNHNWSNILGGGPEGERNINATIITGKLLTHLPPEDWNLVAWPLLQAWNKQNKPQLPGGEVKNVFKSIAKSELARRESTDALHLLRDTAAMQWKEPVPLVSLSKEHAPIGWIWEGFLARGHFTLFAALFKAGKTTLVLWLLKYLQEGKQFAGKELKQTKVLIISEESESLWADRKDEYKLGDGIWIICRPLRRRLTYPEWIDFLKKTAQFCEKNQIELVIIDTISTFWPVRDENDASQVTSAILPFNELLENNLAILGVYHDRKTGGEEGTAIRGSSALPAYADIIIEFKRFDPERREDTRRVIKTYSRFEETTPEFVLELTPSGYEIHGTKAQVIQEEKMAVLLNLLPPEPESWPIKKVISEWPVDEYGKPPHKTTVHRWLQKLKEQGKTKTTGKSNEKGNPDLWARTIALQPPPHMDATQQKNTTPPQLSGSSRVFPFEDLSQAEQSYVLEADKSGS